MSLRRMKKTLLVKVIVFHRSQSLGARLLAYQYRKPNWRHSK